jgi:hypothetical protein
MFSRRQIRQAGKIGGQTLNTAGSIERGVLNVDKMFPQKQIRRTI